MLLRLLDETCGRGWGKIGLLSLGGRRQCHIHGTWLLLANLGVLEMSIRKTLVAAAALGVAALATTGFAKAADLPVKAVKAKPDLPFFLLIDDRVTFSYIFSGTDPGVWSRRPDGSIDGKT